MVLGIDVGGSGIKGAIVDIDKGELLTERFRLPTPQPSTPKAIANTISEIASRFDWKGKIGCGFPAAIHHGIARTAANIDQSWIGTNAERLISEVTGCPTIVLNDADAAGLAEMEFGAGKGFSGEVIMVTVGTGFGIAIFTQGMLYPNAELGHIVLHGEDAEHYATDAARKRLALSWDDWGKRFNEYLQRLESLMWPDLFILGGGASKKYHLYASHLNVEARVVPAQLLNEAGIVGAALAGGVFSMGH